MNKDKKRKLDAYKRTEVFTAKRETLLLMMYAGSIRFLKEAIEANDAGKHVERSRLVGKAQKIVSELRCNLNFEQGGDISQNLDLLYGFVSERMVRGNLKRDSSLLSEALDILVTLNTAWEEAIEKLKTA